MGLVGDPSEKERSRKERYWGIREREGALVWLAEEPAPPVCQVVESPDGGECVPGLIRQLAAVPVTGAIGRVK